MRGKSELNILSLPWIKHLFQIKIIENKHTYHISADNKIIQILCEKKRLNAHI